MTFRAKARISGIALGGLARIINGAKYRIANKIATILRKCPKISYQATLSERVSMTDMTAREIPPPGMRGGTRTRKPVRVAYWSARSLLLIRFRPKASQQKRMVEVEVEVDGGVAM